MFAFTCLESAVHQQHVVCVWRYCPARFGMLLPADVMCPIGPRRLIWAFWRLRTWLYRWVIYACPVWKLGQALGCRLCYSGTNKDVILEDTIFSLCADVGTYIGCVMCRRRAFSSSSSPARMVGDVTVWEQVCSSACYSSAAAQCNEMEGQSGTLQPTTSTYLGTIRSLVPRYRDILACRSTSGKREAANAQSSALVCVPEN